MHRAIQSNKCITLLLIVFSSLAGLVTTSAKDIYFTDFENFTAGSNNWAGTEGWVSANANNVNGIDDGVIPGFEKKTAFLGFYQPQTTLSSVVRPFNYDHVANHTPILQIDTIMGIQDSTNLRRDSFLFSILNSSGVTIAGLQFNNNDFLFGIYRRNGTQQPFDTGQDFFRNSLHLIGMTINLTNNTWSASIDGIPLFTDSQFNGTGQPVNFGSFAFQWDLAAFGPQGFGDNWLLVSDLNITGIPIGTESYAASIQPQSPVKLNWLGEPGFNYQVEHSDDLATWTNTLPNSLFTGLQTDLTLEFMDSTMDRATNRYYRVQRTITP